MIIQKTGKGGKALSERLRQLGNKPAQELQNSATLASALVTSAFGVSGLKCALDLQGYYGGLPRLPLVPVNEKVRDEIRAAFHDIPS